MTIKNRAYPNNMENSESHFSINLIAYIIAEVSLFCIGLFVQFKIITVCWKDKEGKTWQIHLINSVIVSVYFAFVIPFWISTNAIPHLAAYTGEWFCYLAAFIRFYGFYIIVPSSLWIAIMKYCFILQNNKILQVGEEKTKKVFLLIYLIFPLIFATISCMVNDFDSYSDLTSCFGLTDHALDKYNTTGKNYQKFLFCKMNITDEDVSDRYVFYIMAQCFCVFKSILFFFLNTNVPEAIIYYQIFKKMRR